MKFPKFLSPPEKVGHLFEPLHAGPKRYISFYTEMGRNEKLRTRTGDRGPGTGERATGNGQRATGNGQRATGNGQRVTGNGQRATGNVQRATLNGERTAGTG